MQFTIEERELTNGHAPLAGENMRARRTVIDAVDANEAISQFVHDSAAVLVSCETPARGAESIATVKKEERVFLVRVYAD